jgi:hypothetical protein
MSLKRRGIPKQTCHYNSDPVRDNVLVAECTGEMFVLQDLFKYCPFCGHVIEKDPPKQKGQQHEVQ